MTLRWLFLDLNSYFASVEQQLQPSLRGQPLIVVPLMSNATSAIAASYQAKKLGIKTGTPVWEARQICPSIAIVPARPRVYVEFHHKILAEVERHAPIDRVYSIDEAACKLQGRDQSPEAAIKLGRAIKAGIRARVGDCLTCSVGIAPSGLLAKIASDMQKPDGLTVLTQDSLPGRLLDLKLTDLPGIGHNMERRLNARSIYTISALWALSYHQVRTIWGGVPGERFLRSLKGEDIQLIDPKRKTTIGHSHVLSPHLRPATAARAVARELVAKAAQRLRKADYVAARLFLSVRVEHGPRWGLDFRLRPTDDSQIILSALDAVWDRLPLSAATRLKKISVGLFDLTPRSAMTGDVFDWARQKAETERPRPQPRANLSTVMDVLNTRYGRHTVTLGPRPDAKANFVGTKIAFSRVPSLDE